MHIKKKIWEINEADLPAVSTGLICLKSSSPVLGKICKDLVFKRGKVSFQTKVAQEVTRDWVISELKTPNLFGNNDSYFIHFADQLNKDVIEELKDSTEILTDNRVILLNFEAHSSLLKKYQKQESVMIVEVESPAFWEFDSLFHYFLRYFSIKLNHSTVDKILAYLPEDIEEYYNFAHQISVLKGDEIQVLQVLENKKNIQFDLARNLSLKKFQLFYQMILDREYTYDQYRSLFSFLQGHLLKIADPSYTEKKKRLNQYDKNILQWSKAWSRIEIRNVLVKLAEFEIQAKSKDSFLKHSLEANLVRFK